MNFKTKKQWFDYIWKETTKFKREYPDYVKVKKKAEAKLKLTKQQKNVKRVFESSALTSYFGSGELVNALLGKKVITKSNSRDEDRNNRNFLKHGVAVIPTKCENSHNYDLERVCVGTGAKENECLKNNGFTGNHLGVEEGEYKYPTKKQVEYFISKIKLGELNATLGLGVHA